MVREESVLVDIRRHDGVGLHVHRVSAAVRLDAER